MKEKLIKEIIEKYSFANKKQNDPNFCPCYDHDHGKKCHDIGDMELICIFCYCPEYIQSMEIPEGKCNINSPDGVYFHHKNLPPKGIWDCSSCEIPQTRNFVSNYLTRFSEDKLKKILETNFRTSRELFDFLNEQINVF
ncbi:MAG: hypothetical protein Q7R52_05215 [archaeon]|nr:hypothetical protein [archaeon]